MLVQRCCRNAWNRADEVADVLRLVSYTAKRTFENYDQSHIMRLHTTGNIDKADLAPSTISLHTAQPESKLGLYASAAPIRAQFASIDRQKRFAANCTKTVARRPSNRHRAVLTCAASVAAPAVLTAAHRSARRAH